MNGFDHDQMMAAKVAILEALLVDVLIDKFAAMPDGIAAAVAYAEVRKRPAVRRDPVLDLAFEESFAALLDRVVAGVRLRGAPS